MKNKKNRKKENKRTAKQIAALACAILLVTMYVVTLIAACLDFDGTMKLFSGCLVMTVGLPILLWIFIWVYGIYKDKHNMASLDMLHSGEYTGTNLDIPENKPENPTQSL